MFADLHATEDDKNDQDDTPLISAKPQANGDVDEQIGQFFYI